MLKFAGWYGEWQKQAGVQVFWEKIYFNVLEIGMEPNGH